MSMLYIEDLVEKLDYTGSMSYYYRMLDKDLTSGLVNVKNDNEIMGMLKFLNRSSQIESIDLEEYEDSEIDENEDDMLFETHVELGGLMRDNVIDEAQVEEMWEHESASDEPKSIDLSTEGEDNGKKKENSSQVEIPPIGTKKNMARKSKAKGVAARGSGSQLSMGTRAKIANAIPVGSQPSIGIRAKAAATKPSAS
ncbi:hypothetical protein LOK49_LG01G03270 [Camellia lanceoleosa]|uniref:Uncharacterized protein n=1 Tax=Camellia lanceoleosa TaxID=1840588 RepID=A0ACC0J4M8_9ERIC|nr:hypothetical protein LOK49_LG01G03270 [Camellia lanceoleosa]